MPEVKLPPIDKQAEFYTPAGKEKDVLDLVSKRVEGLKELRKEKLPNNSRSIEEIWKEADYEYQPHELEVATRSRFESDDELGLRSRLVKVGQQDNWQSNAASNDFYVKVNTALSILIDQNPEAWFMASSKKYEKATQVAYANWKQSWEVSGAKQQIKHFVFNQIKYGTGYLRTYPRLLKQNKRVLKEYYSDQPDKNRYEEKTIIKYNDLARESLNPWSVWLGKSTKPGDYFTLEESYFEKTYSWDSFQNEFKDYKNSKFVQKGLFSIPENVEQNDYFASKNDVTVGFYENSVLDIYSIYIPEVKINLYHSPLPNDDGMMSITFAPWSLRDDRIHFGIGLFEIIRNDVVLHDKVKNMTVDQIMLMIYKMFFYKGTDVLGDNEQLVLSPGIGKQVSDPNAIKFLEVPGPGREAWEGLQFLKDQIDTASGVTPQLSAKFSSKTLGQDIQAKEAALERMKTPLDYILDALQQEAYLSLSWQNQILSTPEVIQYQDPEDLKFALNEMGLASEDIDKYVQEASNPSPQSELLFQSAPDEQGMQSNYANVYPERALSLDKDNNGELIESEDKRFFRMGIDLKPSALKWRGMIRVKPQSILAPSKELTKRMKLDLFNLVFPATQTMLGNPMTIDLLFPQLKQIIKVYEENPKDWGLDDEVIAGISKALKNPPQQPEEKPRLSISVKFETLTLDEQAQILAKYTGIKPDRVMGQEQPEEEPLFVDADHSGEQMNTEVMKPLAPRQGMSAQASNEGMIGNMMQIK